MNLLTRNQAKDYIESGGYLDKPKAGLYQDSNIWISFNFLDNPDGNIKEHRTESEAFLTLIQQS